MSEDRKGIELKIKKEQVMETANAVARGTPKFLKAKYNSINRRLNKVV